jgi:hypothetical protein
MFDWKYFLGSAIVVCLAAAFFCFVIWAADKENSQILECQNKGGLYLTKERKCVELKRIPLSGE